MIARWKFRIGLSIVWWGLRLFPAHTRSLHEFTQGYLLACVDYDSMTTGHY